MKTVWTGILLVTTLALGAGAAAAQSPAQPQTRRERIRARIESRIQARFDKLDTNHDGALARDEWPGAPKRFDRLDRNHDGVLTKDELVRAVMHRKMARRAQHGRG